MIYFGATRDFRDITGKILPYSFIKSLGMLVNKYPYYKLYKCVNKIVSPDKEDMTDYMMLAVLALKRDDVQGLVDSSFKIAPSDAHLYRRVGLLFSVSEDNQVGLFGLCLTNSTKVWLLIRLMQRLLNPYWLIGPTSGRLL